MSNTLNFTNAIRLAQLASDPVGDNGMMYYNTTTNTIRQYLNGIWSDVTAGTATLTGLPLPSAGIIVGNGSNVSAAVPLSGDAALSNAGALTLNTVNSNVGSFGSASASPSVTVNAKGLVTAASATAIQIAESQVTNLVTDLAGKQPTGNYITSLTGDITGSGPGAAATTLATVNGSPGTFGSASNSLTAVVNGKGLVTSLSSQAIQIAESQVTNLVSDLAATEKTANKGAANGYAPLDASAKIPVAYLPSVVMEYQQAWNPATNTPSLSDGTGTNGFVYRVSTAFTGAISGLTDSSMAVFYVGDLVIYSGTLAKWQRAPSADGVTSVNGAVGAVTVNAINQLTGDITAGPASGSVSAASTLATVNGSPGTFGSASTSLTATVNGKGLVTSLTSQSIQIAESQVTNLVSDLAGKQPTGSYLTSLTGDVTASGPGAGAATLATVNGSPGSFGSASTSLTATVNAKGLITALSSQAIQIAESQVTNLVTDLAGKQPTGNYITALTGDATASGPGSAVITLATVNGNVGTFVNATVTANAKGLITAISSTTPAGDIKETRFTAADNQSSPANVTGLAFANASVRSFETTLSIVRGSTYAQYKMNGVQAASSWYMTQSYVGDNTGLIFTITAAGQVQYTSTSTGNSATLVYRAITTSV